MEQMHRNYLGYGQGLPFGLESGVLAGREPAPGLEGSIPQGKGGFYWR